jgi:import inner membrane translocase subunit TIM23
VATPRDATLDWNTFFRLRKVRRWYHLVASFVTAMGTTVTGVVVFSQRDVDTAVARMFGLEPFLVLGIATVACGALGWLAGPFLGNSVFNLVYRRMRTQLALVRMIGYMPILSLFQ